jgi:hypothetical protein
MDGPDDVDDGPVAADYWYVDDPDGVLHITWAQEGDVGSISLCGRWIGSTWRWRRHRTSSGFYATCSGCKRRA